VIFGQRALRRQLAKAKGVGQVLFDVVDQLPAQVRCQTTLEAQPVTQSHLIYQNVTEHFVGQAAGQQTFAGLVPVQLDQLLETPGLLGVVDEGAFAQLQLARFAIQQGDAAERKLFGTDVQMRQPQVAIDHPRRVMPSGQHA
jgi:hypothetical protein